MARFDSLKYPVHKRDLKVPMDVQFPNLFRIPEMKRLKERGTWQMIATYIVLMYDKGTDLVSEYPSDLKARKEEAAMLAGYTKDAKDVWGKEIQAIMGIKIPEVHEAIFAFLKEQKNVIWREIVVTENELDDFQSLRLKPVDTGNARSKRKKGDDKEEETIKNKGTTDKDIYDAANKKDALMAACDKRIKHLEVLWGQFYGDSKKELMEAEFEEQITPETAERIMGQYAPQTVPATEPIANVLSPNGG